MKNQFDIAIIGSGLNGLTSAICAKMAGYSCAIFDISENFFAQAKQDNRTSALTASTVSFFTSLNLNFQKSPIKHIYSFMDEKDPVLAFDANDLLLDAVGYMAKNSELKKVMLEKLKDLEVPFFESATCTNFQIDDYKAEFEAKNENFSCNLIIACDGKSSHFAKHFGLERRKFPYADCAIVCNIKHELEHNQIAIEDFVGESILAFLPLEDQKTSAMVFSVPKSISDYISKLTDKEVVEVLNHSSWRAGRHLGKILSIDGKITYYPLEISYFKSQALKRALLVGDSFNSIHPVAGQSFNMSVMDIKNIYHKLQDAQRLGLDTGSFSFLKSIEQKNILKNHLPINFATHFLVSHFKIKNELIRTVTAKAIKTINSIPKLKQILTSFAN